MKPFAHPSSMRVHQRGSILVSAAFAVIIGLVVLMSAQIGYLYYMKRELQKAVDLSALSAVQVLAPTGLLADCVAGSPVFLAAQTSAVENVPGFVDQITAADVTVECKLWDPTRTDANGSHLFDPDPNTSDRVNAVQVRIDKTLSSLFPSIVGDWLGGADVSVKAAAAGSAPIAAFSVESRLVRLASDGLVGKLLTSLGASPEQLTVLDSAGLLNLSITPSGLLKELGLPLSVLSGIGSPDELVALDSVQLGDLLSATLAVLQSGSGTAQAQIDLLGKIIGVLLDVAPLSTEVKLFGEGGLLNVGLATDAQAALQADVRVADLLQTSLMVANGDNLIDLGLNVPILGVVSKVRVIEPPSIQIGGVGTRASTAGVRVYLRVNTTNIPIVGPLLSTLGTRVDLPLILEVGQSDATLTKLCEAPLTAQQAVFDVRSSVANVCLGKFPAMSSNEEFFSTTNACIENEFTDVQRHQILNVLGLLPLSSRITLPVFRAGEPVEVTLTEAPSPDSSKTVNATDLNLTQLVRNVVDAVIAGLLGDLLNQGSRIPANQADDFAKKLVGNSGIGKSVSEVINDLNWSANEIDKLNDRVVNGGLLGVLGGTLHVVGNVLDTVLALTSDTVCLLGLTPDNIRNCRTGAVATLGLTGEANAVSGLMNVVIALLQPLLDPLSLLLQNLLQVLGLNLGETDVTLLSVDCGKPRLVY